MVAVVSIDGRHKDNRVERAMLRRRFHQRKGFCYSFWPTPYTCLSGFIFESSLRKVLLVSTMFCFHFVVERSPSPS